MSDALGKYIVVRANGVCAETNGPSSKYHDTFESAADEATAQSRKAKDQNYAVARIVSVFEQELQTVEHRLEDFIP